MNHDSAPLVIFETGEEAVKHGPGGASWADDEGHLFVMIPGTGPHLDAIPVTRDQQRAQAEAMLMAQESGTDTLNRHQGGLWAPPTAPLDGTGQPVEHCGTPTVLAMIRKGLVHVTATSRNRLGEFPTQVKLTPLP
jgi:hypothetical protein